MKKLSSTVLLALIGLFALSVDARAQEKSVVATVPHAFVAAGKTFPAGTYTISPVTSDTQPVLKIRNNETAQSAAFLLPVSAGNAVDHSGLTFKRASGMRTTSAGSQPMSPSIPCASPRQPPA